MPGIIFELDIDGLIWALAVKIALWTISLIAGVVLALFGYLLCMIVAPFTFARAYKEEKREIREICVFSDEKIVSGLDSLNSVMM